ncbi:tlde1 domain-containing protein [Rhizobium sp. 2MFCol3.1]|uniref:tlde1 domain-containing protein n=1 Tax=Rhizobium sp. 2MFCol3.1 TaxID=1246459 RepID=UPI0003AB4584|nr:tlde1 domain-containing protein [Rhizobium sp. 2MFCol3.1]
MAFAVDVFANTRPVGTSISRFSRSFRLMSGAGLIGASFAASAWVVTSIATMHAVAPAPYKNAIGDIALVQHTAAAAPKERNIHVSKFSRLQPLTAENRSSKRDRLLTPDVLRAAFVGTSGPVIADALPARTVVAAAQPSKVKDDAVAAAPQVASASSSDRIVIPSKAEIAALEGPALLALAAMPKAASNEQQARVAVTAPASIPAKPAAVEVASVDVESDASKGDDAGNAFGLVLNDNNSVPLPMARPDGMTKRAPANDRASRPAEPVLAYARPDIGDDEGEIPVVPKRQASPVARAGVAVYDISASMVYLPNGERLEAHSGLGKMRDNPKYVREKMRGPTPPHTYQLTMRESLFHGVEAIRLNPVGGAGNIFNRVGLLAHTYMLGARGDSNGCVSFKDYKRFLAAFKRGDIRQLVVVESMPDKPRSTFASLFSSRS